MRPSAVSDGANATTKLFVSVRLRFPGVPSFFLKYIGLCWHFACLSSGYECFTRSQDCSRGKNQHAFGFMGGSTLSILPGPIPCVSRRRGLHASSREASVTDFSVTRQKAHSVLAGKKPAPIRTPWRFRGGHGNADLNYRAFLRAFNTGILRILSWERICQ